ncbi:hypothetical protein [Rhodopseudomonas palustris]|nr:hypothetical protein [Rhodopseudomonas palustris]
MTKEDDVNNDAPPAPARQGYTDRPKRYRLRTRRGWEIYLPPTGEPVPFAVEHRGEICLVHSVVSDAQYFAKYPEARYRFTVRIDNEAMDWTFVTRQGGTISGDRYDLFCRLQHDRHGTVEARLKRVLLRYATIETHMVRRDAPDLISALQ